MAGQSKHQIRVSDLIRDEKSFAAAAKKRRINYIVDFLHPIVVCRVVQLLGRKLKRRQERKEERENSSRCLAVFSTFVAGAHSVQIINY